MKVMVIGSGGREHALVKKIAQSPLVETVYCAPGNAGMTKDNSQETMKIRRVPILETEHEKLLEFSKEQHLSWSFIGPEIPLMEGLADLFRKEGESIIGPSAQAAMIEGSKAFAKKLMHSYDIPTAASQSFTAYEQAATYAREQPLPIVIKADGLAAGKGVVIANSYEEADQALRDMLTEQRFGASGETVVIEEFLEGEEVSLLAFVRGEEVYPMIPAQDHKRAYEGNQGPNTGGMGAYAPVPQLPKERIDEAVEKILQPTAKAMVQENCPFFGILYAGLILTKDGPKVIEFNARFGDPETQVILPRLVNDFVQVINDFLAGRPLSLEWKRDTVHLGVVLAANGYPETYDKRQPLSDLSLIPPGIDLIYAGVEEMHGQLLTNGGRVLMAVTEGKTIAEAQKKVYSALSEGSWSGLFYRKDIGFQGAVSEK